MNLIPRKLAQAKDPLTDLLDIQSQMNDLFDFSLGRWFDRGGSATGPARIWAPAIDVHEDKDQYLVKADLPGLNREDIDITVEGDLLVIKGEKKEESEKKEKGVLRSERFHGWFQRAIELPGGVDPAKVKASYKEGVLEVAVPKREDAKPKSVKIDVA